MLFVKILSHAIFFAALLLSCECYSKDTYLIPFKQGESWGMSDENGQLIVPCNYASVQYVEPYIFATNKTENGSIKIFDKAGKFIDTCYFYTPLTKCRICIFKRTNAGQQHFFSINDKKINQYVNDLFAGKISWTLFTTPVTMAILEEGKQKSLPGIAAGYVYALDVACVSVNGKAGIYNIEKDTFVVKPAYEHIIYIKPELLLAKNKNATTLYGYDGTKYSYHPAPNAIYIDKTTGNYVLKDSTIPSPTTGPGYHLLNKNGKEILSGMQDWQYGPTPTSPKYIRLRKPKEELKYGESVFRLLSLKGDVILNSVQEIQNVGNNVLQVTDIGKGVRKKYIYNADLNKIVLADSDLRTDFSTSEGFIELHKDKVRYFYDYAGVQVAAIADSVMRYKPREYFVQRIDIGVDDSTRLATGKTHNRYFAIRADTTKAYTIYDESFRVVNNNYHLFGYASNSKWRPAKRDNKWTIVDNRFSEAVPAAYDEPLKIDDNKFAIGKKNGVRKRIDLETRSEVDMGAIEDFGFSSYDGKWLGASYYPRGNYSDKPSIKRLYITDSLGNMLDSMLHNENSYYRYLYTAKGKLLRYGSREEYGAGETSLMPGLIGTPEICPYRVARIEQSNKKAVLLLVVNDKREMGLASADDFSMVVPFGVYDRLYIKPYTLPAIDKSDARGLEVLMITGEAKESGEAASDPANKWATPFGSRPIAPPVTTIGFYEISGKKYWSK